MFVCSILMLMLCVPMNAAAGSFGQSIFETLPDEIEPAARQKPSLEDDFKENRVIVVLKHAFSEVNADIALEKFETENMTVSASLKCSVNGDEVIEAEDSKVVKIRNVQDLTVVENARTNSLVSLDNFRQILSIELEEPGKEKVLEAISELERLDMVWAAVPDYNYEIAEDYTPNDPYYSSRQWGTQKISAGSAWDITTGNANIKVGVMESGIASHSDLSANVGEGNFTPSSDTDLSHGTHVAGIISAVINNGTGIAGTAQTKLIPLNSSDFVGSLTYAMNNNIPVINASFYFAQTVADGNKVPAPWNLVHEAAIKNYNGLLVCSAGSRGANTDTSPQYPACYPASNVISVGASTSTDTKASFSNYGAASVDLFAPGDSIYSTVPGGYDYYSGTSMAAPYVTGTLALMMSAKSGMDPQQMKDLLLDSVDTVSDSAITNLCSSGGRLNAFKAVSAANKMVAYFPQRFTADVNGDGRDDIIQIRVFDENWQFYTFLGKADGTVSSSPIKTLSAHAYDRNFNVFVTDINGDGRDDFIVEWTSGNDYFKTENIYVYRGTVSGTFLLCARTFTTAKYYYHMKAV